MDIDQETLNRIRDGLKTTTELLDNPEGLSMAEGYLDKLAYELEMIAEMAGSLAVEDVSEISDYIDTLQAQLSQQIETDKVPKDMSQFVFSVLSRLSNITARLRYYASEG